MRTGTIAESATSTALAIGPVLERSARSDLLVHMQLIHDVNDEMRKREHARDADFRREQAR